MRGIDRAFDVGDGPGEEDFAEVSNLHRIADRGHLLRIAEDESDGPDLTRRLLAGDPRQHRITHMHATKQRRDRIGARRVGRGGGERRL